MSELQWNVCQLCGSRHSVHMGVCIDCSYSVGDVRIGDVVFAPMGGVRLEVVGKYLDNGDLVVAPLGSGGGCELNQRIPRSSLVRDLRGEA